MGLSTPKNKKVQEGPSELEKLKKKKTLKNCLYFKGLSFLVQKNLKLFNLNFF